MSVAPLPARVWVEPGSTPELGDGLEEFLVDGSSVLRREQIREEEG